MSFQVYVTLAEELYGLAPGKKIIYPLVHVTHTEELYGLTLGGKIIHHLVHVTHTGKSRGSQLWKEKIIHHLFRWRPTLWAQP
jgi:hypothetical protein